LRIPADRGGSGGGVAQPRDQAPLELGNRDSEQAPSRFRASCSQLHAAIGGFLNPELAIPAEAGAEGAPLMAVLCRAAFALTPGHQQVLDTFRGSGEALFAPFTEMQKACAAMLQMLGQPSTMNKEAYAATVCDLQQEINSCAGDRVTALLLRMMLDVLRAHHGHHDAPLELLCPLSLGLMRDPVLLHQTAAAN
ncbi:MAG: hypothetical protein WDW38_009840, partial [Sanguina aurantia]